MSDITKIKVANESEISYQLYPRNEEFAKRSDTQPDWNQNDNTKPDYVKNRPFYTGAPVETVLVEEQIVTFTSGWSDTSFDFDISSEDIVKVIWDGTEYICIPKIHPNWFYFGNRFLDDEQFEDTGEPFYYDGESFFAASSADSHLIKVSKISNEVIQIDLKYIPNGNIRNGLSRFSTEEGTSTKASGVGSHAEGSDTTASGKYAHAEGIFTIASGDYSHVEGKYNIEDTANKYAHIIGNGKLPSELHNCFMVGWDGAIYVQASDDATKMMKLTIKSDGTISAEQVTV